MRSFRYQECDTCSVPFQSPECADLLQKRECPGHIAELKSTKEWLKSTKESYEKIMGEPLSQKKLDLWGCCE